VKQGRKATSLIKIVGLPER